MDDLKLKDLLNIIGMSVRYFNETPLNTKIGNQSIGKEELVALSYYESVVTFLNSKGCLVKDVPKPKKTTEDSEIPERDYLYD